MPKRNSDGRGVGRRKGKSRRRHLYLVMNDKEGYAIRKMDLSSGCDSDDEEQQIAIDTVEERLPPAQIRFESPKCKFFAAIGTKIMDTYSTWPKRAVPVLDVRRRWLTLGPRPRARPSKPIYVPVGDKLVAVDKKGAELLYPPPPEHSYLDKWLWLDLPKPPFKVEGVTSHAAHPDGRTLFISVKRQTSAATFTFDTMSWNTGWKRHGKWKLPFTGRAHFDPGLDAWVGLSDTLGYLCSCDVVSIDADSSSRKSPAWKLSKEKLFCEDPDEIHIGADLVYMGGRSRFCLVHYFSIRDDESNEELDEDEHHMLRLTTFTLKYDKNGDLRTDTNCQIRCFKLPGGAWFLDDSLRNPVAFWM